MIKVCLIFRKPNVGNYSIEGLFTNLFSEVSAPYIVERVVLPYHSKGIRRRILNILWLRKIKADVYHITGDVNYLIPFLPKGKTVLTIHDCVFMNGKSNLRRLFLWLFWIYLPSRNATLCTAVSAEARNEFANFSGLKSEEIRVIYNYYNSVYSSLPKNVLEKFKILHIGTKPNKNLHRLSEALRGLNITLVIIGVLSESQKMVLSANNIDFENYWNLSLKEVFDCYSKVDILCFVSEKEGFGLPILEAQSMGRVVITSNRSSMPEIAGAGALLVDPYDVQDIRRGIESVLYDEQLRNNLIDRGYKNLSRFTREATMNAYLDVYSKIVNYRKC